MSKNSSEYTWHHLRTNENAQKIKLDILVEIGQ